MNDRLLNAADENKVELSRADFSVLTARSGLFNVKQLSGFGFVAEGVGSRAGELVLVTRGTNFEGNKFDLGTNANCGIAFGPRGNPVHRGFLKTFKDYQNQLANFVSDGGRKRPKTIHCMGHSLGGALANLNAAVLNDMGFDVHLYTIGAPRVGLLPFANDLMRRIPAERIRRAVNPCDPVPLVPLFPFVHGSRDVSEFLITSGADKLNFAAHFMSDGYSLMMHKSSWTDFTRPTSLLRIHLNDLEAALVKVGGGQMFSVTTLRLIGEALTALAKLFGHGYLTCLQVGFSALFTAADLLAEMLIKVSRATDQFMEAVRTILSAMLGFMGRAALGSGDIAVTTLRWIVSQFATEVSGVAQQAMLGALKGTGR
ncbi:MAG TPA: lipase family protein [Limnobacter sp.]|nr:lipase family protein [Limnobacter sp.]